MKQVLESQDQNAKFLTKLCFHLSIRERPFDFYVCVCVCGGGGGDECKKITLALDIFFSVCRSLVFYAVQSWIFFIQY